MECENIIRVMTVMLGCKIKFEEVPYLRGAFIASVGRNSDIVFHNHLGSEGYRYSYPLIQYKCIDGQAAVVCVQEGIEAMGEFFINPPQRLHLGKRVVSLENCKLIPSFNEIQFTNEFLYYKINRWLPLNAENYRIYHEMDTLVERIRFLEKILKGNILSMCKGLGIFLNEELELDLVDLGNPVSVFYKGVKMLGFEVTFKANIALPNFIGLGKNASIGFGILSRK